MKKPVKVLFTVPYGKENMERVGGLGYETFFIRESELDIDKVPEDIEILVCYDPFRLIDIAGLKNLKWIQLVSKGVDQVPAKIAENHELTVTNNGDATAVPISEWIVAMLLFIFKNSAAIHNNKNNRQWVVDKGILELSGKIIGFLGTGNIAGKAAERLQPFGVKLLGLNTAGRPVPPFSECYSTDKIEGFLRECDAVISTLPGTEDTKQLLNKKTFAMMKKGVTLINVSRGSVVDEAALAAFLEKGHFRGVALDVFNREPLPDDSPLWNFENVIITPHNAYLSDSYRDRVFEIIFSNLKNYIEQSPLQNTVNFKKGY